MGKPAFAVFSVLKWRKQRTKCKVEKAMDGRITHSQMSPLANFHCAKREQIFVETDGEKKTC